jgi:hypothetical protein
VLQRSFEWLRSVHPDPSTEMVDRRKQTVGSLIEGLKGDTDFGKVLDLASASVGAKRFLEASEETTQKLREAITAHQSAFPSDLSENALELQVVACLVVGEIVELAAKKKAQSMDPQGVVAASAITSGLASRQQSGKEHFDRVMSELRATCSGLLAKVAEQERSTEIIDDFDKVTAAAELPSMSKALKPILKSNAALVRQMREELDVLWWATNGYVEALNTRLIDVPVPAAGILAALELARLIQPPAPLSARTVMRRLLPTAQVSAKQIANALATDALGVLAKGNSAMELARGRPVLFPLGWLLDRLKESGSSTGWEAEFERKTGLASSLTLPVVDWGLQYLEELNCARLVERFSE